MTHPSRTLLALAPLLLAGAAAAQEPAPLDYRLRPDAELWFEVRALAESEAPLDAADPLAPAVAKARELAAMFSSPLSWGLLDAYMLTQEREPGAFTLAFDRVLRFPDHLRAEGVRRKAPNEVALELAALLDEAGPTWLAERWPQRVPLLEERRAELLEVLGPSTQEEAATLIRQWLDLPAPKAITPLLVVTRMPEPGGTTLRVEGGGSLCVVAVGERTGSLLAEVVLHEALHAFDGWPNHPPPVFMSLARQLTWGRVPPELSGKVVHTLFFLVAADLVRLLVDPEHVPYGESQGYYAKVPEILAVERPLWERYVAGEIERPDLVQGIAEAFTGKPGRGEEKKGGEGDGRGDRSARQDR